MAYNKKHPPPPKKGKYIIDYKLCPQTKYKKLKKGGWLLVISSFFKNFSVTVLSHASG